MKRTVLFLTGAGTGIAVTIAAVFWTGWPLAPATAPEPVATAGSSKTPLKHGGHDSVALDDDQIRDAGIALAQVAGGTLKRHSLAPGSLIPDADHIGRVSVRVLATVSELRKRIGDNVEKGEIVAAIESREVADAKSEYLGARLTSDLQQTLFGRLKILVESRAVSENEFLRARLTANDAQIKLDSARQKLFALGLSEKEIADLPNEPPETLQRQFLRSPITGRVSERRVDLGGLIGREGQESELFVIVNLDDIWVDLAVSPEDIASLREQQPITIRALGIEGETPAQVIFVSPLLDRDTRNARVIATMPNRDHRWKPGTFVTAEIPIGGAAARILVTKRALQTSRGKPVVFVRTAAGFEARPVRTGREDDDDVEILGGLAAGETVAVANTFTLKAELENGEAEHE